MNLLLKSNSIFNLLFRFIPFFLLKCNLHTLKYIDIEGAVDASLHRYTCVYIYIKC